MFARIVCALLHEAHGDAFAFGQRHAGLHAQHAERGRPGVGQQAAFGDHRYQRRVVQRLAGARVEAVRQATTVDIAVPPSVTGAGHAAIGQLDDAGR